MKKLIIDGNIIKTKAQIHKYLKEELKFPDYYGENLDALYDCLTEIDYDLYVEFKNYESLKKNLKIYAKSLAEVFEDLKEDGYIEDVVYD